MRNIFEDNFILVIIIAALAVLVIINFIVLLIIRQKIRKQKPEPEEKTEPAGDETSIIKKEDMEKILQPAKDIPSPEKETEKEKEEKQQEQEKEKEKEKAALRKLVKGLETDAVKLDLAPNVREADFKTAPGLYFDEETSGGPEDVVLNFGRYNIEPSDETALEVPVIKVDHVTMEFKREKDESSSLKELAIKTVTKKREVEKFKALDDVSFTVYKGEVVGIIGTNGSGKSTILKIISGVLDPTEGHVETDKNKIQLLTLGTGFDHELTGRENVYLNGAIIGYTKEFIDEKYDSIVKFAELEGFMEEKVKNYSSGMVSRLGFAIATAEETPEILILDEVLSVGDMFFRKKSLARIKEMIHGGSTVLIVSHSTGVIKSNCSRVVWIEKGHLRMIGEPDTVCAAYERMSP